MANVTSSGNTTIKPTINAAKFMGSSHAAGSALENEIKNINLRLSFLAGDIRKNLASINSITEILNSHSHIDDENDVNNTNNENESKLDEISNILLDIGNAMSLDFANRIAENKEDIGDLKKQKSKGKFGRAESGVEKQKKERVAGNIFTKTASKAASPFSDIFGKLISLGGILGTGILTNAVFEWFKNEDNQKKVSKFFKILVKNWKWIIGTIGVLVTARIIADLILLIKGISLLGGLLLGKGLLGKALIGTLLLGSTKFLPEGGQGLGLIERQTIKILENMEGGATEENRNLLIKELEKEREEIGPIDLSSRKSEIDNQIKFLKSGQLSSKKDIMTKKFDFNQMKIVPIDTSKIKVDNLSKKSGMNFIPINLPTITKNQPQLPALSSVATNVLHISSKNVSDPYRQLTPNIYGIYV
mgnify:CR=1 FL=1